MKKAFTLIETLVAVSMLAMVVAFASVIFKVGIESYRMAGANADVILKLRAITDQLDRDFQGFAKDGYLILHCELKNRKEFENSSDRYDFRADRILYFTTGDFQSWFPPYTRSNIAQVYFGHDIRSLNDVDLPVSKWRLARDNLLLTQGATIPPPPQIVDYNNVSFAELKAKPLLYVQDANILLRTGVEVNIQNPDDSIRRLMCKDVGEIKIDWTLNGYEWWGMGNPIGGAFADQKVEQISDDEPIYWVGWRPDTEDEFRPKALRFTFTLYDPKGIFKAGRNFTHIVYIGE